MASNIKYTHKETFDFSKELATPCDGTMFYRIIHVHRYKIQFGFVKNGIAERTPHMLYLHTSYMSH